MRLFHRKIKKELPLAFGVANLRSVQKRKAKNVVVARNTKLKNWRCV